MRSVRPVVRPLIAALIALSCAVLVAATAQASVQRIQHPSSRTVPAASHSLAVSITGVTTQQRGDPPAVRYLEDLDRHRERNAVQPYRLDPPRHPGAAAVVPADVPHPVGHGQLRPRRPRIPPERPGHPGDGRRHQPEPGAGQRRDRPLDRVFQPPPVVRLRVQPDPRRLPAAGTGHLGHQRLPGNQPYLPALLDRHRLGHPAQGRLDLAADRHPAAGCLPADARDELAVRRLRRQRAAVDAARRRPPVRPRRTT